MENYVAEIIIGLIVMLIGYVIKNSLTAVSAKLDDVLKQLQSHDVGMAKVVKDVESNTRFSKIHTDKLEALTRKTSDLDRNQSSIMEWKKQAELR